MDIKFDIYQNWKDGYLDYSFSCDGYEGIIGKVNYLKGGGMMVLFNIDPDFHGYGIGKTAFKQAYEELSRRSRIKFIKGKWMKSKEFSHLENGCCANFNIYKKGKKRGLSNHQAALATPTGKCASALGYNKVALIKENSSRVEVLFYRNVSEAGMDISFGIESYLLS